MHELDSRHHGLETFLRSSATKQADSDGLKIVVDANVGHVNLRGNPENSEFVRRTEEALGQALPVKPNTFTDGIQRIFWLGPDEWLLSGDHVTTSDQRRKLQRVLHLLHASVNDVSGGVIALTLCGGSSAQVLSKGCTLDLHPDEFTIGQCAQTGLAKSNVLLAHIIDAATGRLPNYQILVRRSFADYVLRWLSNAGKEFEVGFTFD